MAKKKGKKRARLRLEDLHLEPWQRAEIEKQLGRAIGAGAAGGEEDVVGLEVAVDEGVTDRDMKPANALEEGAPARPRMNKTEAAYAEVLEQRRLAGDVLWYGFEACTLRLAHHTHYRPDFAVMVAQKILAADGPPGTYTNRLFAWKLEFHEVKGFWRDDARAKIKIAAEHFPFLFLAVRKRKRAEGGGWYTERFPGLEAAAR